MRICYLNLKEDLVGENIYNLSRVVFYLIHEQVSYEEGAYRLLIDYLIKVNYVLLFTAHVLFNII